MWKNKNGRHFGPKGHVRSMKKSKGKKKSKNTKQVIQLITSPISNYVYDLLFERAVYKL